MSYNDENQKDSKPKSLLEMWRERRARLAPAAGPGLLTAWLRRKANLPTGAPQGCVTAPFPPGEQTPGVPDAGSPAGKKDDCGRPEPKVHRDTPTGGPFRPTA